MKTRIAGLLVLLSLCTSVVAGQGGANINDDTRTYIVHMDRSFTRGAMAATPLSRYKKLLQTATMDSANGEIRRPIHVYSTVCNGFSARLTSEEATALGAMSGVLQVLPDKRYSLHTTRTPQFLGLNTGNGLWPVGNFGEDVIIGVLDTGVWPERESFSDAGLGPVPARWKGRCESTPDFNASEVCNRKLIGARYYIAGYEEYVVNTTGRPLNATRSPRDTEGHGTHTASTAAGAEVAGANLFGLANGTARGIAPRARIAVYKICWPEGCFTSDILAAFDQAIADGVDVISLSVGGPAEDYFSNGIAIGAFGAMQKGVFVSCSAGNAGPGPETVKNDAPWIMTVAASTLDRDFPATATLGDATVLQGQSLWNGASLNETEMITGAAASLGNVSQSTLCLPGSLDPALATGKIVVCRRGPNRVAKGAEVLAAGGVGMILYAANAGGVLADAHLLPATHVDTAEGTLLLAYMNATRSPVASLQFLGTRYNVTAPVVAGFSSRGPSYTTPRVLKPDITAPGVNVLAAWTGAVGPADLPYDTRRVSFNIISGTSMSCPHVSGLAALLKAAHRDWTPAAIKSAMMTTATVRNNVGSLITDQNLGGDATPFQYGSGHVRPDLALDPGLVYDMEPQDYVNFLCALRYTPRQLQLFTNETVNTCPVVPVRVEDMNYPSFSAVFTSRVNLTTSLTRTVTNVGSANATYRAIVVAPVELTLITVTPDVLTFSAVNEKKSFTVHVTVVNAPNATVEDFGYLLWSDGAHVVQSPIAVTVYK